MLIFLASLCIPPSWEGSIMASRLFSKGRLLAYRSHEKAKFWQQSPGPRRYFQSSYQVPWCYFIFPVTHWSQEHFAPNSRPETHPPFPIKRFFSFFFREEMTFLSPTWREPCCLGTCWRHFLKIKKISPRPNLLVRSGTSRFKVPSLFKRKQH